MEIPGARDFGAEETGFRLVNINGEVGNGKFEETARVKSVIKAYIIEVLRLVRSMNHKPVNH